MIRSLLFLLASATLTLAGPTPSPTPFALPHLEWTPNPATEVVTEYRVYDRVGTQYFYQASVLAPLTKYLAIDFSVVHNYTVTAVNLAGEGPRSNEIVTPVAPTAPTTLALKP